MPYNVNSFARPVRRAVFSSALLMMLTLGLAVAHEDKDDDDNNIVTDVVIAPVVTNGSVAGEPTEIHIYLNAPGAKDRVAFDAANFGHQIPGGGRM